MGTNKKPSTLHTGGVYVNVIWQPKYIGARREAWLLEGKMEKYLSKGGNQTVYITFEKDGRYNMSGRVYRVKGGHLHITMECELFHHEETGCNYYRVPLDDLVEVFDVPLPCAFLRRVEEHRKRGEEATTSGSYPTKGEIAVLTKEDFLEEEISNIEAEEPSMLDDYGLEELDDFEEEEQVDEE